MRDRIAHSRAIVREIGERLRAALKQEPELSAGLKMQIDRLRELEEQSPSMVPDAERWDKTWHRAASDSNERLGRTWTSNAFGEGPCVKNFE